jgi:hypothetical protein
MSGVDPLARVQLHQQRLHLERELETLSGPAVDMRKLEAGFVTAVRGYRERNGISYAASHGDERARRILLTDHSRIE